MKPIKKGYLYDDEGGTDHLSYEEWAVEHIQDSEVAYSIACGMLNDPDGRHENTALRERVFEVYTIVDVAGFVEQMNEFEDDDRQQTTYRVRRFYADDSHPEHGKVVKAGLSRGQARQHCNDPASRGTNPKTGETVWFDGFDAE